jgi:hypothetical protein
MSRELTTRIYSTPPDNAPSGDGITYYDDNTHLDPNNGVTFVPWDNRNVAWIGKWTYGSVIHKYFGPCLPDIVIQMHERDTFYTNLAGDGSYQWIVERGERDRTKLKQGLDKDSAPFQAASNTILQFTDVVFTPFTELKHADVATCFSRMPSDCLPHVPLLLHKYPFVFLGEGRKRHLFFCRKRDVMKQILNELRNVCAEMILSCNMLVF